MMSFNNCFNNIIKSQWVQLNHNPNNSHRKNIQTSTLNMKIKRIQTAMMKSLIIYHNCLNSIKLYLIRNKNQMKKKNEKQE